MTDHPIPALTILVVDDEPVLLTFLRRMLETEGYQVRTAGSAEDAMALLERIVQPELAIVDATIDERLTAPHWAVVSDIHLPQMNGCALGRAIVARWPEIRMLFISGYVADWLVAKKICPRNLPLLVKPFRPKEFLAAVRRTLATDPWRPSGDWPEPEGERA